MPGRVDASEVLRMLAAARKAFESPRVTDAVRAALAVYQAGIQRRAPRKTGDLANNFTIEVAGSSGSVTSDQIKALTQEQGAWIAPKNKKALRFSGPPVAFVKKPVHVPARPYVAPTFSDDSDKAVDAFAEQVDRNIQF